MIGTMTIVPELQPHVGDRDDYIVSLIGPEPSTPEMRIPVSFTGTVLAIWGVDSKEAATKVILTIFGEGIGSRGTGSGFPEQGYWFDSYNSEDTLKQTLDKIRNEGDMTFAKNRSASGVYGLLVGQESADIMDRLDKEFNDKYGFDFFKELDEVFALSEIVDTLTNPPKDKPNFLYRVSLLSSLIDSIHIKLRGEKEVICPNCGQTIAGSIKAFSNWLASEFNEETAKKSVETFKQIKHLRNQFPIHNHFELKSGIRVEKASVLNAYSFFSINSKMSYEDQWHRVLLKFNTSLLDISALIK